MSYDYINEKYGIEFTVSHFVRCAITSRIGTVMPKRHGDAGFVQVLFHGEKFIQPCHPTELETVDEF